MSLRIVESFVSPRGVRSIWLRNDLNNINKRLKALEAKIVQDDIVLTEAQLHVLRNVVMIKKRVEKSILSILGYLGCQDTDERILELPSTNMKITYKKRSKYGQ